MLRSNTTEMWVLEIRFPILSSSSEQKDFVFLRLWKRKLPTWSVRVGQHQCGTYSQNRLETNPKLGGNISIPVQSMGIGGFDVDWYSPWGAS